MPKDGTSGKLTGSVNRAASGLSFPCANNLNEAYESYCKMLLTAAKKNIPVAFTKPTSPAGMMDVTPYFVPMQNPKTLRTGTKQQAEQQTQAKMDRDC